VRLSRVANGKPSSAWKATRLPAQTRPTTIAIEWPEKEELHLRRLFSSGKFTT
jgi:hypothetical protein